MASVKNKLNMDCKTCEEKNEGTYFLGKNIFYIYILYFYMVFQKCSQKLTVTVTKPT